MEKQCTNCTSTFEITEEDLKFYERVSPIFNGKKYQIPPPTHCPDCRQQRRAAFSNEHNLYPGECGLCHQKTLTQYPPDLNITYYCRECWHSDKWDPLDYGRDFDFNRPFFQQLRELFFATPTQALIIDGFNENSEYIHYAGSSKNSYLIMHADFCESCYYGYGFKHNDYCVDGFYNLHCELCYDCIDVHKCYGLRGCQDCQNCSSSAFLRDCIGCKNCFLCTGIRNKEYCFENKQLSKDEYEEKIANIDLGSYEQYQKLHKQRKELEKTHTFKEFQGQNLENCLGDHLTNCKNTKYSFDCEDTEDCKFCYQVVLGAKNVYDIYQYGSNLQESYEICDTGANSYHMLFTQDGHMTSAELTYCWYMETSKNCFGCANMLRKNHCIFNKQYSKEEYEKLTAKITEHMIKTGEWGEFLPMTISPFGYNKTSAHMYYPLTKETAPSWDDYEPPRPDVKNVIKSNELPDNIKDTPTDILQSAIECEKTQKLFKLTSKELEFYKKQNLPLPRRCPNARHMDRFHKRNPRKFWKRECAKCKKEITTSYSPESSKIVYCEDCYKKAIY